jgi:hypothetical protein
METPGRAHGHQLRAGGERAEAHQGADQRRDREDLVGVARHAQQHEPERIGEAIAFLLQTPQLIGQQKEGQQRQQHRERHQGAGDDGAGEVAIEPIHRAARRRAPRLGFDALDSRRTDTTRLRMSQTGPCVPAIPKVPVDSTQQK